MKLEPGQDFAIKFINKTDRSRTEKELNELIIKLIKIAQKYDFGSPSYGSWESITKTAIGEQAIIDKYAN